MELGRDGGMDGLHVRGVRAFIPRERRDWAELLQEEGIFPKVGPRGQATTSQRLPVGSRAGGGAGGLSRVSIALALRALLRSRTNFGPCHAQGDQDTPCPRTGGQVRTEVAGEATPRAAPRLQAP